MDPRKLIFTALLLLMAGGAISSYGRVARIEITRVESPTFEGMSFGNTGQCEKPVGTRKGGDRFDGPGRFSNHGYRPGSRNASGLVEYSADIYILRPIDASKGNHRLFV